MVQKLSPVTPESESARRHADLIYDVGMHKGEDTDFYLKKGFRVIGFEADPDLIEHCKNRFSREIEQGRLTIVEGAIVEGTEEITGQSVRFYQNKNNSVWGTIQGDWARRNETLGAPSSTIEVKTVDFASYLRQYGVPYYLKVDIEGSDTVCLRALVNFEQKPDYVSIESEKVTFAKLLEEFHLFRKLGYTAFKAVQQKGISLQVEPTECREGFYADYKFREGASGLFGEDLPGKWRNYDEILAEYKTIFLLYNLFGPLQQWRERGRWPSRVHRPPVDTADRLGHTGSPGWANSNAQSGPIQSSEITGSPAAPCSRSRCMNTLNSVSPKSGAKHFFSKVLKRALRKYLRRLLPGWYDTHARHSSHVPKVKSLNAAS